MLIRPITIRCSAFVNSGCTHSPGGAIKVTWLRKGYRRWTHDQEVVGSTPGQVAIKWLLLGWATVCGQVNHLGI